MEQAIHAAAGIGLQFLFLCAALLAAIGFRFLFMTRQLIPWPWVKPVTGANDSDKSFRMGRSAGIYYYLLAIQQCGINNTNAVQDRRANLIGAAQLCVRTEEWDSFEAGTREGIAMLDAALAEQQVNTITRHMPEIQVHVAQISSKLMRATTLTTGEAATLIISAKSDVNKLQGITK
jgi:hypothetical protein